MCWLRHTFVFCGLYTVILLKIIIHKFLMKKKKDVYALKTKISVIFFIKFDL